MKLWLGLATVVFQAGLLAGCDDAPAMRPSPVEPVNTVAPTEGVIVSAPEWHKNDANPANKAGAFGWEGVDPRFVTATANYSKETRALFAQSIEVTALARCVRDLGEAIDSVPNPGGVNVKATAERIRDEAARTAGAPPVESGVDSPQKASLKAALTLASGAVADLGRTSYAVPSVSRAVGEFERSLVDITPVGPLASHQPAIYIALQRADDVLKAIGVEAAKRAAASK